MLKDWQFNALFCVGVGGAVVLLFGPSLAKVGIVVSDNPLTIAGVGAILTFVLQQKKFFTRNGKKEEESNGSS